MPGFNHKGGYKRKINLIGERFGRLVVIEESEPFRKKDGGIQSAGWLCRCDCGKEIVVRANSLRMGKTKSCGCLNREKPSNHITHHMSNTIIYSKYKGMLARCYNKNSEGYKHYGGRGITVCEEWLNNFQAFYDWAMANGYTDNLTIERKDVDGNYCPENCCWIPREHQAFNKTNTIRDKNNNSIAEMSRKAGIVEPNIARFRYKSGWSLQDAIYTPKMKEGETLEKVKKSNEKFERSSIGVRISSGTMDAVKRRRSLCDNHT